MLVKAWSQKSSLENCVSQYLVQYSRFFLFPGALWKSEKIRPKALQTIIYIMIFIHNMLNKSAKSLMLIDILMILQEIVSSVTVNFSPIK